MLDAYLSPHSDTAASEHQTMPQTLWNVAHLQATAREYAQVGALGAAAVLGALILVDSRQGRAVLEHSRSTVNALLLGEPVSQIARDGQGVTRTAVIKEADALSLDAAADRPTVRDAQFSETANASISTHDANSAAFLADTPLDQQLEAVRASDAEFLRTARVLAHNAVREVSPDLSDQTAAALVNELHLVPASFASVKKISNIDLARVQREIVLHTQELKDADPAGKAVTLRHRAKSYEDLGHNDLALKDLNESFELQRDERGNLKSSYVSLQHRSRVQAKLGDMAAADADYLESTKVIAHQNVRAFHPNMPEEQVAETAERLRLVPPSADAARTVADQILYTQFNVIRLHKRLEIAASEKEQGEILFQRAKWYADLGHNDLAHSDREESARLLGSLANAQHD